MEKGNSDAMNIYAFMLENGNGVPINKKKLLIITRCQSKKETQMQC